jgi:hypothetical protein
LKKYGSGEEVALEPVDGYAAEIAYFAECCAKGEQPVMCTPESSADAVGLALAIFEARKKNGERISWK